MTKTIIDTEDFELSISVNITWDQWGIPIEISWWNLLGGYKMFEVHILCFKFTLERWYGRQKEDNREGIVWLRK